jgi:hypothetical protein
VCDPRDLDPTDEADRGRLVARLRSQGRSAAGLGSPLYAHLLPLVADDVAAGGPCWAVLRTVAREPDAAAVPLRFLAAVHRLVLRRLAPALALHYASVGGTAPADGAWPPFRDAVEQHRDLLADLVALPCQTNEVGRSAALAPGLLHLQARHRLPLVHLELGASAGLNLRWDRFRYATADGGVAWGDPASPVDLSGHWLAMDPDLPPAADVVERRGCDPAPIDTADPAGREALTASVWPDQHARHQRLRGALALAAELPVVVDAQGAGDWLPERLDARPDGTTAVVTHSVVWRYIPAEEQVKIRGIMTDTGSAATPTRRLAWMHLEPQPPATTYDGDPYPITVTEWPGGATRVLGTAQAHGQDVVWATAGAP